MKYLKRIDRAVVIIHTIGLIKYYRFQLLTSGEIAKIEAELKAESEEEM